MSDLKEFYCKKLSEIKKYLPANYIAEIHKRMNTIPKHKIVDAFRGKVSDTNVLAQIFTEAHFQARKYTNDRKVAERKMTELKNAIVKVVVFFFSFFGKDLC